MAHATPGAALDGYVQIVANGGIDFGNLTGFVNDPRVVGVEAGYNF